MTDKSKVLTHLLVDGPDKIRPVAHCGKTQFLTQETSISEAAYSKLNDDEKKAKNMCPACLNPPTLNRFKATEHI